MTPVLEKISPFKKFCATLTSWEKLPHFAAEILSSSQSIAFFTFNILCAQWCLRLEFYQKSCQKIPKSRGFLCSKYVRGQRIFKSMKTANPCHPAKSDDHDSTDFARSCR